MKNSQKQIPWILILRLEIGHLNISRHMDQIILAKGSEWLWSCLHGPNYLRTLQYPLEIFLPEEAPPVTEFPLLGWDQALFPVSDISNTRLSA